MKLSERFKSIFLQISCCFCLLFTASTIFCISISKNPMDFSQKNVQILNDRKLVDTEDKVSAQFLVRAAEICLLQINYAQLAQTHANTVDVKELGKINELFHTKKYVEIITVLQEKKYSIPTSLNSNDEENFSNVYRAKNDSFDKKLCNGIAASNANAIDVFEKMKSNTHDTLIIKMASTIISQLKNQREYTLICQNKFQQYK
jgi:hypothetical protein